MSYKDLLIQTSYETTENKTQLLEEFYIPLLEQSKQYFRIAGFFSSSSLVIASKGIEGLIKNNGIMRLLISPRLSEQDVKVLKSSNYEELPDTLSIFQELNVDDFSELDNLQALAWLLAIVVGGAFFGDNLSFISDTTLFIPASTITFSGPKIREATLFPLPSIFISSPSRVIALVPIR